MVTREWLEQEGSRLVRRNVDQRKALHILEDVYSKGYIWDEEVQAALGRIVGTLAHRIARTDERAACIEERVR